MSDFTLEGPKWGSPDLGTAGGVVTWAADPSLPTSFLAVIEAAFRDWSSHANIAFQKVASTAASRIDFETRAIDGLDNVVGQTTYSWTGHTLSSATIDFDSGEGWHSTGTRVTSASGIDLFVVALHEIGHAIGLDHYNTAPAVMNAVLDRGLSDLKASDIDGVQALYGSTAATGSTVNIFQATPAPQATVIPLSQETVYRFYDTVTKDHFFTTDPAEKAALQAGVPTMSYEGTPWTTPTKGPGTVDVFRFYDTATQTHFLTQDAAERDSILKNLPGYRYEGVAFQAYAAPGDGTVALERFYNAATHTHTYSADAAEIALIKAGGAGQGWIDEGASFIVHRVEADVFVV